MAQVTRLIEIGSRDWRKIERPCKEHPFNCPSGPNIEYFADGQFLDAEIVEKIVFQTNLYITQNRTNVPPITKEELYAFISINMFMSYHKLLSWTHYWSTDVHFSVPFVSTVRPKKNKGVSYFVL